MVDRAKRLADSLRGFLIGLSRPVKSAVAFTVDLIGFSLSVLFAFWLLALGSYAIENVVVVIFTALVSVGLAWFQGMYRSIVRYMGLDLLLAGARTAIFSAIAGGILMQVFVFGGTPRRWAVAYAMFAFIYVCGSRYFARMFLVERRAKRNRENVIIYGAGSAGDRLITSLKGNDQYLPVAMLDDDKTLQGTKVQGLEVHAPTKLKALCEEFEVGRLLLALPSVKGRNRRRILEQLSVFPVHVQTVPDFDHIVSGKSRVDDLSDVDVKDLLGRDPVPANPELLEGCIAGKSVMVTGAGGSIGSELCRQICTLKPKQLILFEISESALYDINRQLKSMAADPDCKIVALLGSVYDQERVREVMDAFSIQTVYHAAAYKHVPIVEDNLFEGIHNNVYGTLHTVQAAIEANVETFVLVSTDKAVSPTSVMGATKRLAELILQAQHSRDSKTRICMVRFGNVLESSGSVVPLFREQIRNGGPVTVTHRDIIRYFMTIPEAAELVIQAGSMAEGGDVFVLDMGEPVRIRDLAYRMINLMGLSVLDDENPDGDIEIKYIGLRPAEKLYEELLIGDNVSGTGHPLIMRAHEDFIPYESLLPLLRQLSGFAEDRDRFGARDWLKQVVSGYQPTNDIDDLVWRERQVGNVDVETKVIRFTPDSGRDRRHH